MRYDMALNTPLKVILVDDDTTILQVHSKLLRAMGHTVLAFEFPRDAVNYILQNSDKIDLIVTDFCMPMLNGSELLRQIREAGINTPVLILTGYPDDVDPLSTTVHNASILCKPVRMSLLMETIMGLFSSASCESI